MASDIRLSLEEKLVGVKILMTVIMSETLKEKLERVKKRTWWPVANLADVLEKPKKYIYRKINDGKFKIINDMGIMKISSDSVVKFFENRYQKV